MTRVPSAILCGILLFAPLADSFGAEQTKYTYVWTPRSTDVGNSDSKDYLVLEAVLRLCEPVTYRIQNGEYLDYIIRKEFLVSQRYNHAFHLYLWRIKELNPDLRDLNRLVVGEAIVLPGGPKYGATELAETLLPSSLYVSTFRSMSEQAYGLQGPSQKKIRKFATNSLRAYVAPSGEGSTSDLFSSIEERGLVYPVDLNKHPDTGLLQAQILNLSVTDDRTRSAIAAIIKADPQNLLPGMFPVSDSIPVSCSPPCTDCAESLQVPDGTDVTKARVLVEDTGIAPGIADPDHVIPQTTGDNGEDQSTQSHGTFVYSEIAAQTTAGPKNLFGLIPKENVYVTRAVQPQGGSEYFSMSAIMNGWKFFSALMGNDPSAATTWVVNVSAFGEPVPDPDHPPLIPNDGHLLIVAAAGNDDSDSEPALEAFPRLSNGSTPLIIAGALGKDGKPTSYTNWNSEYVHLFAPGDCVCGAPGQLNGTSQAAPFVSTAAAVLSSAKPKWNPRYVMWRLISTADHPLVLQGKAFGGTVDLSRALNPFIIIEEQVPGGALKLHQANSIVYDENWKRAFQQSGVNIVNKETLRLYSPSPGAGANEICFTSLEILYLTLTPVCVNSNSQIQFTENGVLQTLTASQISDVILPMPSSGESASTLPNVTIDPAE